jgi:hypothetical protein
LDVAGPEHLLDLIAQVGDICFDVFELVALSLVRLPEQASLACLVRVVVVGDGGGKRKDGVEERRYLGVGERRKAMKGLSSGRERSRRGLSLLFAILKYVFDVVCDGCWLKAGKAGKAGGADG